METSTENNSPFTPIFQTFSYTLTLGLAYVAILTLAIACALTLFSILRWVNTMAMIFRKSQSHI